MSWIRKEEEGEKNRDDLKMKTTKVTWFVEKDEQWSVHFVCKYACVYWLGMIILLQGGKERMYCMKSNANRSRSITKGERETHCFLTDNRKNLSKQKKKRENNNQGKNNKKKWMQKKNKNLNCLKNIDIEIEKMKQTRKNDPHTCK